MRHDRQLSAARGARSQTVSPAIRMLARMSRIASSNSTTPGIILRDRRKQYAHFPLTTSDNPRFPFAAISADQFLLNRNHASRKRTRAQISRNRRSCSESQSCDTKGLYDECCGSPTATGYHDAGHRAGARRCEITASMKAYCIAADRLRLCQGDGYPTSCEKTGRNLDSSAVALQPCRTVDVIASRGTGSTGGMLAISSFMAKIKLFTTLARPDRFGQEQREQAASMAVPGAVPSAGGVIHLGGNYLGALRWALPTASRR